MNKKIIKDDNGNQVLPITHVTAVLDNNGNNIQDIVDSTESSLEALSGYFVCETNGSTAAKVVSATDYKLTVGGSIKIKFEHAHTLSEGTVTLNINNQGVKTILYAGDTVTSSNTWDDNEIVNVFYDGTNYLAYSVEGGGLLNSMDVTDPSTKKGLTESVIVSIVGDVRKSGGVYLDLQSQINSLSVTSTAVALKVRNSSATSFVNLVGASGSEVTWQIYGTSTPLEAAMQLEKRTNDTSGTWSAWSNDGSATSAVNDSDEAFYRTIATDTPITYEFRASDLIYSTTKITNSVYFYYVQPVYYGALLAYDNDDPEEPIIYDTIDDLINGTVEYQEHLIGASARTNAKGTYSMSFDTHPRRVYILIPRVKVSNINPSTVYWVSVINSNLMPFSRAKGSDGTTLIDEGTAYYAYYSDRVYDVAEGTEGNRNIIFN